MKKKIAWLILSCLMLSLVFVSPVLAHHKDTHDKGGGESEDNNCDFSDIPENTIYICDKKWWAGVTQVEGMYRLNGSTNVIELTASTTVVITNNTMVTWVNKENTPHDVMVEDTSGDEFMSPILKNSENWGYTFKGYTFNIDAEFHCHRHEKSMAHVPVVVQ